MKQHTTIGARMLSGSDSSLLAMARQIALSHHERWNGTGYPAGIAGAEIPESARIVAIVDVYDALTHDRVDRGALPHDCVLQMLVDERGLHFDPQLLDRFIARLPAIRAISAAHPDTLVDASTAPSAESRIDWLIDVLDFTQA